MRTPPAEVLLAWPNPNYTDPVTRGNLLVIVNIVLFSLAVLLVAARLYTRLCVKLWAGLDDVFICLALVSPLHSPLPRLMRKTSRLTRETVALCRRLDGRRAPRQPDVRLGPPRLRHPPAHTQAHAANRNGCEAALHRVRDIHAPEPLRVLLPAAPGLEQGRPHLGRARQRRVHHRHLLLADLPRRLPVYACE
jgi:hypothetical protein